MVDLFSFLAKLTESKKSDDGKSTAKASKPKLEVEDKELKSCSGNIVDLVIPDGITGIWAGALESDVQKTLKTVVIPEGIEYIRSNTFQDCRNLVSVKLPESVRYIQSKAFANCVNLRKINFPKNIRGIDEDAFLNCPHIKVPEMEEEIDEDEYYRRRMDEIVGGVPDDSIKNPQTPRPTKHNFIHGNTLIGMRTDDFTVPAYEAINASSFRMSKIESLHISEGVTVIGKYAFECCPKLKEVYLPKSLVRIDSRAFAECTQLENINFSANLEWIAKDAFDGCEKLKLSESAKRLMQSQDEMTELLAILHSSGIHQSYMKNANMISLNNDGMYMDISRKGDGTYNVSIPVDKWNYKGIDCKTFDELKVKIQRYFKLYI